MSGILFFTFVLFVLYLFTCKYVYDMRILGKKAEECSKDKTYVKKLNHCYKMYSIFITLFIVTCLKFLKYCFHLNAWISGLITVAWGCATVKIMVKIANRKKL